MFRFFVNLYMNWCYEKYQRHYLSIYIQKCSYIRVLWKADQLTPTFARHIPIGTKKVFSFTDRFSPPVAFSCANGGRHLFRSAGKFYLLLFQHNWIENIHLNVTWENIWWRIPLVSVRDFLQFLNFWQRTFHVRAIPLKKCRVRRTSAR